MMFGFSKKLFVVISLFVSCFKLPAYAANTYDMADSSNWNLRFDGAEAGDNSGRINYGLVDIDDNGKLDLFIDAWLADNNLRSNSGSVYIISDLLLDKFTGVEQTIDLANPDNYSLRFDGPCDVSIMGGNANEVSFQDMNGDGKLDLLLGAYGTCANSVYIIYNSVITSWLDAGQKNIDLADSANYSLKIYGSAVTQPAFGYTLTAADVNDNGSNDLLIYAREDNNGVRSGSVYLIYDLLIRSYIAKDVDMSDSANYSLRLDGASAYDYFGTNQILVTDLNNNNQTDLLIGASDTAGSLYVIYDSLINSYLGKVVDMSDPANYSLKINGVGSGDEFAKTANISVTDLDDDNKQDLLVGAIFTDNNSRGNSGSFYVIYGSLIESYKTQIIEMSNTTNWSLRFDGARMDDLLSDYSTQVKDFNNDDKIDILTGGFRHDTASKTDAGGIYVIYNDIFKCLGPGQAFDLAEASSYSLLFEGALTDDRASRPLLADFNSDDQLDLFFGSYKSDNNSRDASGSLYVIYNFPHTIDSISLIDNNDGSMITGTISAENSVTSISGVQYSIDDNSFGGDWNSCSPQDGSFDTTSEEFSCTVNAEFTEGSHVVYIRSYDENGSYTAQSRYGEYVLTVLPATGENLFWLFLVGALVILAIYFRQKMCPVTKLSC